MTEPTDPNPFYSQYCEPTQRMGVRYRSFKEEKMKDITTIVYQMYNTPVKVANLQMADSTGLKREDEI